MPKSCPSCGAEALPGARFCRQCGTPLGAGSGDGAGLVSPQAATVPLSDEGHARSTDNIRPDDPRNAGPDTAEVGARELEKLLAARRDAEQATGTQHHQSAVTRPDGYVSPEEEHDGEITITVPRQARPFESDEAPTRVQPLRDTREARQLDSQQPSDEDESLADEELAAVAPRGEREGVRLSWPLVLAGILVLLVLAGLAGWLAANYFRRPERTALTDLPPAPPPDPKQLFEEKLAEAEALLASGDLDGAVARLREANVLDPSNVRAHRRLAEILLDSGQRRAAIESLRAVTRNDPNDFTAWRTLASAQFAEGAYREAAESYRRLFSLVGDAASDPRDLLSYADSLRLSGRETESRVVYERLAEAGLLEVSDAARQRLAQIAQPPSALAEDEADGDEGGAPEPGSGQTVPAAAPVANPPAQLPMPAPTAPASHTPATAPTTPAEHLRRGTELWRAGNREAAAAEFRAALRGGNLDAHYFLGLYYVEGKDLSRLSRAEVVAALDHFQRAQATRYARQSRPYLQQLEREFDRIRAR